MSENHALRALRIPLQFYQISRLYGPGMPASGEEGLKRKVVEKPVGQVGLVLVHCWNLGEPGGPYPISQGERFPGEAADWVPEAHEVIAGRIGPVLEAARRAGIAVFHLVGSCLLKRPIHGLFRRPRTATIPFPFLLSCLLRQ